jgi:hypothetical protein
VNIQQIFLSERSKNLIHAEHHRGDNARKNQHEPKEKFGIKIVGE